MRKQKGSFTVEAMIVMTTVIFILFAIISAFLLLYQNAVMYYIATQAAQEGAVMWADNSHTLEGTAAGTDNQSLYYRIGELAPGGGSGAKTAAIQSWAQRRMREMIPRTLVGSGAETVEVTFHNYVVQRVVEVRITKEVNIPFREIAQFFGKDLDMTVRVQASVSEPAEFIRNVDYGFEVVGALWKELSGYLGKILDSKG